MIVTCIVIVFDVSPLAEHQIFHNLNRKRSIQLFFRYLKIIWMPNLNLAGLTVLTQWLDHVWRISGYLVTFSFSYCTNATYLLLCPSLFPNGHICRGRSESISFVAAPLAGLVVFSPHKLPVVTLVSLPLITVTLYSEENSEITAVKNNRWLADTF